MSWAARNARPPEDNPGGPRTGGACTEVSGHVGAGRKPRALAPTSPRGRAVLRSRQTPSEKPAPDAGIKDHFSCALQFSGRIAVPAGRALTANPLVTLLRALSIWPLAFVLCPSVCNRRRIKGYRSQAPLLGQILIFRAQEGTWATGSEPPRR